MADDDTRLTEALSLIEQGSFGAAGAALSRVAEWRSSSLGARLDAACQLCRAGEAHRQAAAELEAAASQQRASELQVQRRLLTLLSGSATTADQPVVRSNALLNRFRRLRGSARPPAAEAIARTEPAPLQASTFPPEVGPTTVAGPVTMARAVPPVPMVPPAAAEPSRPPAADVVARVLGPFELIVLGREVRDWGGYKGRAVLQFLLLNREQPVRREALMELLWPNHARGSARNNLNVALYALRRSAFPNEIGRGPFVEHRQGAYLLGNTVSWWIDRDGFLEAWTAAATACSQGDTAGTQAAYERAVALYRGRLFEDDPTGEWFFTEQRLLEERFLLVLERLASLHLAAGDVESAEAALQQAIARDACRESAHRLLMQCYAELQQQQLVTRQFNLCVDALDHELGVQPHPETVRQFHDLTGGRS